MEPENCPHLKTAVRKSNQYLLTKSESLCQICGGEGPNLWACLQENCSFTGCGKSRHDHGTTHCNEQGHPVAINLKSFRTWCYACDAEVNIGNLDPDQMKKLKKEKQQQRIAPKVKLEENPKLSSGESPETPKPTNIQFTSLTRLAEILASNPGTSLESAPGLKGLRNLGNTCYMNAALQSLSNCPHLTLFFIALGNLVEDRKKSMTTSYYSLISDIWRNARYSSVAPSSVHSTLKLVNPAFRGYQQQDTQEFLRCLMDRLHEEMKYPVAIEIPTQPSPRFGLSVPDIRSLFHEAGDATALRQAKSLGESPNETPQPGGDDNMTISTSSDESYHSCDDVASLASDEQESQPMLTGSQPESNFPKDFDELHSSGTPLHRSNSMPSILAPPASLDLPDAGKRKRTISSRSTVNFNANSRKQVKTAPTEIRMEYRSVISDIFDGALRSSVQCRTCASLSHTKETFQDLSLPIPGKDDTARLHSTPCSNSENYTWWASFWQWFESWFWGSGVTLTDCLSAFFSADELKGDNMYSCGKCKKLRNGIKYCTLLQLPEVLCIHLKRFRHEYFTSYSTKISSTVIFPLEGLDLSRYLAKDHDSTNAVYDLSSVIVHHGGAGGGHYTSYCKNPVSKQWYEYDDQYVTQVSEATVSEAEPYVLFYSKRSPEMEIAREEVLLLDKDTEPALMKFYVSVEWLIKFLTFAEPGPINNRHFLCPHENADPGMFEQIGSRVCVVSEQTWHAMHRRFGGGPAVTRIHPCTTCIREAKMLEERRSRERHMYRKLSELANEHELAPTFYISMSWFRKWQAFIDGTESVPPCQIDNREITKVKDGRVVLDKDSDYGEILTEAWEYLHFTYGGGPAIPHPAPNIAPVIEQNGVTLMEIE